MKLLSFKITSDHFLLCVFLSLLWGVTYSTTTAPTASTSSTGSTGSTASTASTAAPENVENVTVLGQNETSITVQWKTVDGILNYTLVYNDKDTNITASEGQHNVTLTISGLTSANKYDFILYSLSENVRSSGVNFSAVTAPPDVENVTVLGQNETSITVQWKTVVKILDYTLVYNDKDTNITASKAQDNVILTISGLTSATKYDFILYSLFENVRSSGVNFSAVTAPPDVENVTVLGQNETSITVQWKTVGKILDYTLVYNDKDINITASKAQDNVTLTISGLTSATKYDFILYSLFENVRSSGVNFSAVTAPEDVENVTVLTQNETSITVQWKTVGNILNYTLVYNDKDINITASEGQHNVTLTISGLTSANKYDFILYSLFENVRSSGVNFSAVTAPEDVENVTVLGQNETSITVQWKTVGNILDYTLVYNDKDINITASEGQHNVTLTISGLTSATKYDFILFSLFVKVRSSGVNFSAVTAPENVENVTVLGQNETSITVQWKTVDGILDYTLVYNDKDINITASEGQHNVTLTISGLTSATKYDFILFSLFVKVRSSGVNFSAVTAPEDVENVTVLGQNETSITVQWKTVGNILDYTLVYNDKDINITASKGQHNVTLTISGLTSANKYDFILFSLFVKVRSSGVNFSAVTAPEDVENVTVLGQNETSITVQWKTVGKILDYTLVYNDKDINITVSEGQDNVILTISGLTSATKYDFILFSLFVKVRSSGVNFSAVTAPEDVENVTVLGQNETSITVQWKTVVNILDYTLVYNDKDINFTASKGQDNVILTISGLTSANIHDFILYSLFEKVRSSGVNVRAVTAPRNTEEFELVRRNETSITVQWKKVVNILNYTLVYNEINLYITASEGRDKVTYTISGLTSGTKYDFILYSLFENVRSSGVNFSAVTVPPYLSAHCEYSAAGYSVFIVWNKPDGVWTSVEVNVTGKTTPVPGNEQHSIKISGFQPAKTYEVSLSSVSGTVRSRPFVFSCHTDPRGVIAGSVLAILLLGVLVGVAVLIYFKRPDIIRNKQFIGGSRRSNKKFKAISVANFPDHFSQLDVDEKRGFSQEYESLMPVGTDQTRMDAILPENKAKNRFNNVLPYDWCRVKLTTSNPNGTSDYINASYMPGYNSNREYIATQGPLPTTANDFWRMIWEERVKGIVMVTNCTEGGRTKCDRYWPADSRPVRYGDLSVTIRSEQQEPDWTLREFSVKHTNNSAERKVKHFHFTAWPDHGVPQGTELLIQFRGLVRQHIEREGAGAPTVVHCSAGVGRTGTIMALDVLLQQLEKERAVGINGFVHKMRLSRPHMVQTESQYVFLHQCIMDCLQANEKTEENIYENVDMIYANATALKQFSNTNT
ncbi:receptor-type tyrosine-protein phosphatase H-like isoform X2 [Cottoperca gobio]|uniref:protein-tyrosine-phosphatase n=1 Tax=Cottoperca gobio TaxID=56716 RepID=A0A6J2RQV0_COTGO|nr:receptor-type tyrosine-protein phosphatase H isoform X2 [Cottoperca gobio]